MSEASPSQLATTLRSTLRAIEAETSKNALPPEGLEDLKSAIDDVRFRLWGALSATNSAEYRAFQERFRLRRASEICRGLSGDLASGAMAPDHRELTELREAAQELATEIRRAAHPAR
jgi:hypothetical protein